MPKKKVEIEEPKNIVCEVKGMPPPGEAMIKVEPHEPNKKTRKPLSQDSLDKLKLAREAAYKKRMELKAEREKPKPEPQECLIEPETPPPSPKKKTKSKPKKPIVIMEQSSSDSDEEQQVIYVKKKSKKKVVPEILEPPPQEVVKEPEIPQPVPPAYQQVKANIHPRYGYNPNYSQFSNRRFF